MEVSILLSAMRRCSLRRAAHLSRQAGQLVARHPQLPQIRQRPDACMADQKSTSSIPFKRPCSSTLPVQVQHFMHANQYGLKCRG